MTSIDQSMKRIVLTNRRTGRIRILRLDAEDNLTVIQERPGVWDCAISPDGKWLQTTILTVLAGIDQSPQAWDLTTGRAIKNLQRGCCCFDRAIQHLANAKRNAHSQ
jgi:hypothetical protein